MNVLKVEIQFTLQLPSSSDLCSFLCVVSAVGLDSEADGSNTDIVSVRKIQQSENHNQKLSIRKSQSQITHTLLDLLKVLLIQWVILWPWVLICIWMWFCWAAVPPTLFNSSLQWFNWRLMATSLKWPLLIPVFTPLLPDSHKDCVLQQIDRRHFCDLTVFYDVHTEAILGSSPGSCRVDSLFVYVSCIYFSLWGISFKYVSLQIYRLFCLLFWLFSPWCLFYP